MDYSERTFCYVTRLYDGDNECGCRDDLNVYFTVLMFCIIYNIIILVINYQ